MPGKGSLYEQSPVKSLGTEVSSEPGYSKIFPFLVHRVLSDSEGEHSWKLTPGFFWTPPMHFVSLFLFPFAVINLSCGHMKTSFENGLLWHCLSWYSVYFRWSGIHIFLEFPVGKSLSPSELECFLKLDNNSYLPHGFPCLSLHWGTQS